MLAGTILAMPAYAYNNLALLDRFDSRADTAVTGKLSSLLGEAIAAEALCYWLAAQGHEVELLDGRPIRDDSAFGVNCPKPTVRDLDFWLRLDRVDLCAVEAKQWTASSCDGASVPDEPDELAEFARREWAAVKAAHIDVGDWTHANKIFLPLRPPKGFDGTEAATANARRILVVWRPISHDGREFVSTVEAHSVRNDQLVAVTAEVFSASLYLRSLLASGQTSLPTQLGLTDTILTAVDELFEP